MSNGKSAKDKDKVGIIMIFFFLVCGMKLGF